MAIYALDHKNIIFIGEWEDNNGVKVCKNDYAKVIKLVNGGETRKESSYLGISSIEEDEANRITEELWSEI